MDINSSGYGSDMDVPYFQVPNSVFNASLTKYELLVVIYLCRCQNNRQLSFPSYETIARNCAISRRKAITTVRSLIQKNLLLKQVRPNRYRKNYSNLYSLSMENLPGARETPPSAQHALGSARRAPNKELYNKNYL